MAESADEQRRHESAIEELVRDDGSRKRFLKTVGVGGAGALSLLIAACGGSSSSSSKTAGTTVAPAPVSTSGDVKIVNYALTLEYLETAFYKDVVASGLFKGSELATIKKFGREEAEHVAALTAAVKKLGGTPAPVPKTKFPLNSAKQVLNLASTVENLGAAAYLGQAGNINNKEILAAALSIHTIEARHASALNTLLGKSITPDGAFAKPASMDQVLAAVKPFIVA
jgi:Ferritin-like domain